MRRRGAALRGHPTNYLNVIYQDRDFGEHRNCAAKDSSTFVSLTTAMSLWHSRRATIFMASSDRRFSVKGSGKRINDELLLLCASTPSAVRSHLTLYDTPSIWSSSRFDSIHRPPSIAQPASNAAIQIAVTFLIFTQAKHLSALPLIPAAPARGAKRHDSQKTHVY
jgi:hypothetical protein